MTNLDIVDGLTYLSEVVMRRRQRAKRTLRKKMSAHCMHGYRICAADRSSFSVLPIICEHLRPQSQVSLPLQKNSSVLAPDQSKPPLLPQPLHFLVEKAIYPGTDKNLGEREKSGTG